MLRTRRLGCFEHAALLCVGLYAVVLLVSPVLHHDFECHMKSPGHCQACVANPMAPGAQPSGGLGAAQLADFGLTPLPPSDLPATAPLPLLSGRAPPR